MEISKRSDIFDISDVNDDYIVDGSVYITNSGNINVDFRFSNPDGTVIGNGYYNKHVDFNYVDFGVNCSDEQRVRLLEYANRLVDNVLNHFKEVN